MSEREPVAILNVRRRENIASGNTDKPLHKESMRFGNGIFRRVLEGGLADVTALYSMNKLSKMSATIESYRRNQVISRSAISPTGRCDFARSALKTWRQFPALPIWAIGRFRRRVHQ